VHAEPNTKTYPRGIKITKVEMEEISPQLTANAFHALGNYPLPPQSRTYVVAHIYRYRLNYFRASPN
jgi:hypothetical protein